ncbi:MAG TPA: RIP metalloprotease RseP [Candidatus Desulfofervidus auxilii]|uniref:Zinc metalloprotease n=1 Tax=Desulfofervidus auxilii TaxID=1621989 RepID=A0A7V0IAD8_DESA2|nr:RIP metalloprotease RseP [Candidatus Desulfofervidus auxilii]
MPIIWTVVILGLLIFVHEWGHFLAARLCRVSVKTFSLGFGPKLIRKRFGETEYAVSAFPLGGYVKLLGESIGEYVPEEERYHAFLYQPLLKRAFIVLAGPLFNILFALVTFVLIFGIKGKPILLPKVGAVQPHSPAAKAGLKKGDVIIAVNKMPIESWDELAQGIRQSKGHLNLTIKRNGKVFFVTVMPKVERLKTILGDIVEHPVIGIVAAGEIKIRHLKTQKAVLEGVKQTWSTAKLTLIAIKNLILGKISLKMLAGPVGIVQLTTQQAKAGIAALFAFAALLSINLGIINLFPIPILDGGHLFLFAIEAVRRRPLSPKTVEITNKVGIAILAFLMIMVMYNDILRIIKNTPLP